MDDNGLLKDFRRTLLARRMPAAGSALSSPESAASYATGLKQPILKLIVDRRKIPLPPERSCTENEFRFSPKRGSEHITRRIHQ